MNKDGNLISRFASFADVEPGGIPGASIVEIGGRNRVLIENHCGIVEYGREQIQIKVKNGSICIKGNNLMMTRMTVSQLIVQGCIDCVHLFGGM